MGSRKLFCVYVCILLILAFGFFDCFGFSWTFPHWIPRDSLRFSWTLFKRIQLQIYLVDSLGFPSSPHLGPGQRLSVAYIYKEYIGGACHGGTSPHKPPLPVGLRPPGSSGIEGYPKQMQFWVTKTAPARQWQHLCHNFKVPEG